MALLPIYYTTTNLKKRKTKSYNSSSHNEWLKERGLLPEQIKQRKISDTKWKQKYQEGLKVDRSDYVSAGMEGSASACAKRGVMANLHKEPEHIQKAIIQKSKRIAPLYNKGGLQVITDGTDLHDVGKKK